jgi:hypothetical protein
MVPRAPTGGEGKRITYEIAIASMFAATEISQCPREMPQKRCLARGVLNTALLHADVARGRFSFDSSRYLNHCSNVLTIIRNIGRQNKAGEGA